MASLDEDIEAPQTKVAHQPWPRLTQLPERLAAAGFAPEAFRKELQEANAELVERFRADESVEVLVRPEVKALITAAVELAKSPMRTGGGVKLIVRSVSAKQRPRRKSP